MKNLLENFAILLVGLLSIFIVYLITQYNMIEDQIIEDIDYSVIEKKENAKLNYLQSLENYGEDVDVQVDSTIESTTNTIVVRSEDQNNNLNDVVEDRSSYTKNLKDYASNKPLNYQKTEGEEETSDEPKKLEHEEIVDEIGMAIDAALDDL
ncbi:MAG: hypothetical protein Q9M39_10175 [Sulfurovum sp.]|nr:hypothetical protein [Sulfurovum sp.]